jgi:regulator of ribosome biosynthesis
MGTLEDLPRSRPIPKVKRLSNWDKYAKDKGIVHKRKERMKYDEVDKKWRPAWGPYSVKNAEK